MPTSDDAIQRIVAAQLGETPTNQEPPAPQETEAEKVQEQAAPKDEGDAQAAPAIVYEIDFNGEKRKLTPQQIAATFERYGALNRTHATVKPIVQMAEALMRESGRSAADVATFMVNAMKAYAKNPTMGNTKGEEQDKPDAPNADIDDEALAAWEAENAASLPPGYREMSKQMRALAQMQAETQRMMQMVLAQSRGVADAAAGSVAGAREQQVQAIKAHIANNLNRVQQALGLPDEAGRDFMTFATERGYTIEDFIDPDLAYKVASDFKNYMNSPEMERLRAIAAKRQAYSGSLGSAPANGAAEAQPKNDPLMRIYTKAAKERFLM